MTRILPALVAAVALPVLAIIPPEPRDLHQLEFHHADLWWMSVYQPLDEFPAEWTASARADLDVLGVHHERAFLDVRTGRWGTLILTRPMIPGTGVGNNLRWSQFDADPPRDHYQLMAAAEAAFLRFLADHEDQLGFAASEMAQPRLQVHGDRHIQVHIGRRIDGIPVRDSYITANINSGNLVLMGQRNWADLELDTRPSLDAGQAREVLDSHLRGLRPAAFRHSPTLEIVPASDQPDQGLVTGLGEGLGYRLVWVLEPVFRDDVGTWEALVDAHSGELLSFVDTNHYHSEGDGHGSHGTPSRGVVGGVYPVSNDGVPPDGIEYPGYPMPFANVTLDGSPIGFTTTGGNAPTSASGTLATTLSGQFATINDNCGAVSESSSSGDLDMGDGAGTDCAVPPGSSGGNTSSTRTTYYGLNRIIEQAQGYLPANNWLTSPLTSNMNISSNCNAFWNGSVNFYTSGDGCGNTGEIMAVVHHEWGHGMDANSVNPGISRPGEGIADIYAQNMLNDSCIGSGFRPGQNCGGFGDPCLECTGVRESDWALQQSGQPHDIDWILSACPSGFNTPCGRATHCEGSIVAEALWDLVHRDLQGYDGSAFHYDLNTALELGTRLTYEGAGAVGNWYQCTNNNGGCNADSGYLQYLAADAENGSIEDGTPHMSAIFAAFDRHQLACDTPVVQDAGCESGPAEAPSNLTATTFNEGVQLSWDPVDDATDYWVYRTEGPMGCEFGKARVGQVSGTSFTETGLRNNFDVYYSVIAVGSGGACTGPMSPCVTATPMQGPSGTLQGTIVRGGSGEPLADVMVEAAGDVTFTTQTDASGQYAMTVLEGQYQVSASRAGFESASEADVEIIEDGTIVVDLVLDAPILEVGAGEFNLTVGQNGTTTATLDIFNPGTADLGWTLGTDERLSDAGGRGFDGDFDIDNWELVNSPSNVGGSVNTEDGPPIEVYVTGGDDGTGGDTDFQIEIPVGGTIRFDWGYQSTDSGNWDSGGYAVNGSYTELADNASQVPFFNESVTVEVTAGDVFAFRVNTVDGLFGPGILGVTNFEFEADICGTPGLVEWLAVDPDSGTVLPDASAQSTLMVDADGLPVGLHEAFLCVESTDPTRSELVIPVHLTVSEMEPGELAVSPTDLAFGDVDLGEDATLSFTISNAAAAGAMNLTLSALDAGGDAEFAISGGDCTVGSELEPGDSCSVEVTFTPGAVAGFSGQVDVATTDGQGETVTLSGEGVQDPAELSVSPADLAFGEVDLGEDATLSFMISNVAAAGAMNLELSVLGLTGDAEFSITGGDCSAETELAPGDACSVEVTFVPSAAVSYSGQIDIATIDGQEDTVTLTGEGRQDPGELGVHPAALDFGEVAVTQNSALSLVVSNAAAAGAASLELSALDLSGHAEFAITGGDCGVGTELEPGDSCSVEVTFEPSAEAAFSGQVTVETTDAQGQLVTLAGEGFQLPDEQFHDRFEGQD